MTDTAASAAMASLTAQIDAANTKRLLSYLRRQVPLALGLPANSIVITCVTGNDSVGIAAMSADNCGGATSGSKAEALANLVQWTADRCAEMAGQFESGAAAKGMARAGGKAE